LASRMFVRPNELGAAGDARNAGFNALQAHPFYTAPAPTGVATRTRNQARMGLF